jgi:glycerol-3-phosphate dehydrogenase
MSEQYDLAIIGGGINGCGIARDAAGRGLSVFLCEQDDLAAHTSSWSSKLIHGGLRYLEQCHFRLVRESLQEREALKRIAPHLTRTCLFVLPHEPGMRPAWMLRMGLLLYDRLGGPSTLPRSSAVRFPSSRFGSALKADYRRGFVYSDLQVDDARLTLVNAQGAELMGAIVRPRTAALRARREDGAWVLDVEGRQYGNRYSVRAKALVNAAGPWVRTVQEQVLQQPGKESVRLVRGSHLVVARVEEHGHAYILQQPDGRVVFVLPFLDRFTLIGTTDDPVPTAEAGEVASDAEIDYLLAAANRSLRRTLRREDIVWTYAGVRPLYDDGEAKASEVTRDYVLTLADEAGALPLLNVYGGKLTTYRRLAEAAMLKLQPYFPAMKAAWTASEPLPGGDLDDADDFREQLIARHPQLPAELVGALVARHGSGAIKLLEGVRGLDAMGQHFGAWLTEREVRHMVFQEWATTGDDVLWRRSKCGLMMSESEREQVDLYVIKLLAERTLSRR